MNTKGQRLVKSWFKLLVAPVYLGPLCSVLHPVLRLGRGRRVMRPNSILLDDEIKKDFLLHLSFQFTTCLTPLVDSLLFYNSLLFIVAHFQILIIIQTLSLNNHPILSKKSIQDLVLTCFINYLYIR